MIQDYGELFKRYVEVVEMADNIEPDLDKLYLECGLSFCVFFVVYEGQNCRAFGFEYMGIVWLLQMVCCQISLAMVNT